MTQGSTIRVERPQEESRTIRGFRLDFGLGLVFGTLAAICTSLGFWQLHRAEIRQANDDAIEAHRTEPPVTLSGGEGLDARMRYRRVAVRGRYDAAHQILLDNRVSKGRVGVHALTPLTVPGSRVRVLVDRGWIALPDRRSLPVAPVPERDVEVVGVVDVAPEMLALPGASSGMAAQGALWAVYDRNEFERRSGYPVSAAFVMLDPSVVGGFERELPRPQRKSAMNRGYAVQWFAFAALAVAVYLAACARAGNGGTSEAAS